MSRLTLIFAKMSLTQGDDTDHLIEDKIMDSMNGVYKKKDFNNNLEMWRNFFREYLRYVSAMDPNYESLRSDIRKSMDKLKKSDIFKGAFLGGGRATRDFRKFQEFVNLCKGIARLNGEREVSITSLWHAEKLFETSMDTLKHDAGWRHFARGSSERIAMVADRLKDYAYEVNGGIYESLKDMLDVIPFNEKEWDELVNLKYINPNGNKFKGKWSGWVEMIGDDEQP